MNRTARWLRWGLLLVGAIVVAVIGWTGHQALNARTDFTQLSADLVQLQSQLESGDVSSAAGTLAVAQEHAASALHNTRGPGWWIGEHVPGVGVDVSAVRTVAEVSFDLTHQVLPLVIDAGQAVQPAALSPHDGKIDLAPLSQAQSNVTLAASLLSSEVDTMSQIDPAALTPQLSGPVTELQQKLALASSYANRASVALKLMPGMLGADGPRTYLLIVENNAELRSSGGIAGLYVEITANDGQFTLGPEGTSRTLGDFPHQILPTTPAEDSIFGWAFARFPQNTTQTPDFPRTAELAQAMWQQRMGTQVDGVISADPVALSYILQGTGPVRAADGTTVSADNAVSLLLNQTYIQHPDPAVQDAFFASVAKSVFQALSSGQGSAHGIVSGLVRAGEEGRIHVWSSHPDEESQLAPTPLGGAMPTATDGHPGVGVYLNQNKPSKLDFYLKDTVSLQATRCVADQQELRVDIELTNTLDQNPSRLPAYVVGTPGSYFPPGTMLETIYVYGPIGGELKSATLNGSPAPLSEATQYGRPVGVITVSLAPGASRKVSVVMTGATGDTLDPSLVVTPGAHGSGVGTVGPSVC